MVLVRYAGAVTHPTIGTIKRRSCPEPEARAG